MNRSERNAYILTYCYKRAFDGHATIVEFTDRRSSAPKKEVSTIYFASGHVLAGLVRRVIRDEDVFGAYENGFSVTVRASQRQAKEIAKRIQREYAVAGFGVPTVDSISTGYCF